MEKVLENFVKTSLLSFLELEKNKKIPKIIIQKKIKLKEEIFEKIKLEIPKI